MTLRRFIGVFMLFGLFAAQPSFSEQQSITLIAAGDVEWSGTWFDEDWWEETIFYDSGEKTSAVGAWVPIPRLISPETRTALAKRYPEVMARYNKLHSDGDKAKKEAYRHFEKRKSHGLTFQSDSAWAKYPFQHVASAFRDADVAFINLETPLSDRADRVGAFLTPTAFTEGIVDAGIDVVSIANNHMLDAQIWGLQDTVEALDKAGIHHVGAGKNLAQAREPYIVEKNGIKIAFLAYTQGENNQGFATSYKPGVAFMDPLLIQEDIKRIRGQVDHVILSFHWDTYSIDDTKRFDLHPDAIAFAHDMIDAGADAILGHHPHVPRAVEYYKGKPILYSMAHLIFSVGLPSWMDNYVARLTLTKSAIPSVEILPVGGQMIDLSQPHFLEGKRAQALLSHLQGLSNGMGGNLRIVGDKGVLTPQ